MLGTIVTVLPILIAFGLISIRSRRSAENCRRYLATIERWQPRGLIDGAVPTMLGTSRVLCAMMTRQTRSNENMSPHDYPAQIFKMQSGDGAVSVKG